MATTSQLRQWWAPWECNTSRYTRVEFPGVGRVWSLWVADRSAPAWREFAEVMADTGYLFRESAGGTYNCRNISGSSKRSLHAYAIAIDLNPSKNPYGAPLRHDYPAAFISGIDSIRVGGARAFTWGGRWSTPDAMHWQLDVPPSAFGNQPPPGDDDMATTEGIQRSLNAGGYRGANGKPLTVDGVWGSNTEYAFSAMVADASSQGGPEPVFHTVVRGDTLRSIAEQYDTTTAALIALNPDLDDPDVIRPGQIIRVR